MHITKPKLNPRKLNTQGIAHYVVPLLVVLVVGVVGTYLLVSSHADSIRPPKITKASLSVEFYGEPLPNTGPAGYCRNVRYNYVVKTRGTVDHVTIGEVALHYVNNGEWRGSKGGNIALCAPKKGGTTYPIARGEKAYASTDAIHGGLKTSKLLPYKKVTVK